MRFVDTSFFIAYFRHKERHHAQAAALWASSTAPMLTSVGVLGETWTFLRRREHRAAAVTALDAINASPRITVFEVDDAIVTAAWRWLRRHDERPYSFVDATSFEIMRRRRIREAFAFDEDFASVGFVELRL